ncbi:hypothetical protein SODALDRAFT_329361 [Sodiomyces alkalinus F11]|uniref:Mid2 domain-containing protein n=1 Tax=Sodiomyces alkalinus (strain CBS 110278 / VKM F-3762 / F11) TaxID=1314773 RepID=A0A3N2PKX2_SODAK|nr:hypothetical protein SODALDRAFT_329361 [Sodiomyces alkalinus F11]ROT35181.1 hypothetical protein SODALDRAFT_329361 [Sodiomyces alkalinus F11]
MPSLRACSHCAIALLFSVCTTPAVAVDVKRVDGVHRVEKTHVTIIHNIQRRDMTSSSSCPPNHSLCPASLNGGCCPSGYGCASESCFASTRAPQTCAGRVGYYACAPEVGGGCCPEGYICERGDNCRAPQGVSYSQSCPTNYFLCPSSLNYGCCRDGMGCASNACYSTQPSTYTITRTITTTDSADSEITTTETETETTVSTPSPPTARPTEVDDDAEVVIKFYPSSVSKVEPEIVESNNDSSDDDGGAGGDDGGGGGVTTGQIAGIVVGAVALLVIVLVAAFLIMRRLNKVVRAVESKQGTTRHSNGTKTQTAYRSEKPAVSELDDQSVDPLMMMSSPRPCHRRADSDSEGIGIGSLPRPTPSPVAHGGGGGGVGGSYQAVPDRDRHMSYDSTYPGSSSSGVGYFDVVPDRAHRASQQSGPSWLAGSHHSTANNNNRQSIDSQSTQGHGYTQGYGHVRHFSDGSDYSMNSEVGGTPGARTPQELDGVDSSVMPELPADGTLSPNEAHRRSGGGSAVSAVSGPAVPATSRPPPAARRRSNEGRGRSESSVAGQATLSVVAEAGEVVGHGHYGPVDNFAGQTAVGLESSREPSQDGRREA